MEAIAKILFSFLIATVLLGIIWGVSLTVMALSALCATHPATGFPIVVFIWMCCVWGIHHGFTRA